MNRWSFSGNLGQNPEVRYSQTGIAICNFSVGVSRYAGKDLTGAAQYKTDWFKVVVFGKLAELCGNNIEKGNKVWVSGHAENKEWEKDGVKHREVIMKADEVEWDRNNKAQQQVNNNTKVGYDVSSFGTEVFPEEEIPF